MERRIARPLAVRRAAVIGAGVMGSQIAGWLASVGIPCELLDVASPAPDRDRLARAGLERLAKAKPPALTSERATSLLRPGNVEDHLDRLHDVDLVIEAIVEDLGAKQRLWEVVEPHLSPRAVVGTNTSGLSVRAQAEGRSPEFRKRFLGMHFFNPPRYLRLVEVIPSEATDPDLVLRVTQWLRHVLGKSPVLARDTPNFIGNRVGVYALQVVLAAMRRFGLSPEEVDLITGPVMGRPRSATFRTLDLVGLDTYLHVLDTGASRTNDPEERALLVPPPPIQEMARRGLLGEKAGAGFYRRTPGEGRSAIEVLDWETMEYRPRREARFASVDRAMSAPPSRRLEVLLEGHDDAARFAWDVLLPVLRFSAAKLPEIAYDAAGVDAAMRDGFSWEQGPFEVIDRLGVETVAARLEQEGRPVPELLCRVRQDDPPAFYRHGRESRDPEGRWVAIPEVPEHVHVAVLRRRQAEVWTGPGGTLWDLGSEVAGLECHAPKAAIDEALLEAAERALGELGERWRGLVIFNDGPNFSVGANLFSLLVAARSGSWDEVDRVVRRFQALTTRLKYAPAPVVLAVAGQTLGGGAEMLLHAPGAAAAVESYVGLVETGVGLIPAGGGTKEWLVRALSRLPEGRGIDPQPVVAWAFEVVAQATVAASAPKARELGFLRECDPIVADRDAVVWHAWRRALSMDEAGYRPPAAPAVIPAPGRDVRAALVAGVLDLRRANRITDHEVEVGRRFAHVLCGGDVPGGTPLTEQALLDLEREQFLALLGTEKTQKRIEHVLTTGRPLRN